MNIYPPSYYWEKAKQYIIKKDNELQIEGKYYLDKDLAYRCVKFGSLVRHSSGELAGKNFQFMDFQIHTIVDVLGTKHLQGKFKGLRRYQRVLLYTPKKSGKTEFASLLNIIIFFLDEENAKEIYSIASELEQAKILHKSFVTMIKQDEDLKELVHITKQPPKVTRESGAFTDEYEALSSTADSKDGKRPSTVFVDEGHSHKSKDLYQIMVDGMSGRNQPLEIHMSTAGYDMQNYFYNDIYSYAKKIKDGIIEDETFYYVMYELDEEDMKDPDYWKNPKIWAKVNPNYPRSPTESYMYGKIAQAEQSERTKISFLTKHLNVWCDKADVWLEHKIFTQNQTPIDIEKLKGKPCYGGLDLAKSNDLTAYVLIFPDDSQGFRRYDVICRAFIPKDIMQKRIIRDKVPYYDFLRDGLIETTNGNIIDNDYIAKRIMEDCNYFDVKKFAYDRYNATSIVHKVTEADCTEMIPYNQTTVWFNAPIIEIETLANQGRLNHSNNRLLSWNCSNVVIFTDSSGNIKFDKAKSIEKIDAMVALAMAMGICLIDRKEKEEVSIYESRGLLDL